MFTRHGERENDVMMTAFLVVWAVIGPSVGLAVGAWWCSRERDDEARFASRQVVPAAERSLGWR